MATVGGTGRRVAEISLRACELRCDGGRFFVGRAGAVEWIKDYY
jgi:hypothetical protein